MKAFSEDFDDMSTKDTASLHYTPSFRTISHNSELDVITSYNKLRSPTPRADNVMPGIACCIWKTQYVRARMSRKKPSTGRYGTGIHNSSYTLPASVSSYGH